MAEKFNWDKLATEAYKAYQSGDFATSEKFFQSAAKKLKRTDKGDARLGYAYMMIGSCQYHKHNFEEAISYFKSAVEIYRALGDQRLIDNLSWLGICFYNLKRWREASTEFLDAIKMHRILKRDNKHDLLNTLAYCGSSLWSLGKFDKAEAIFRKGITLGSPQSVPLANFKFLAETLFNLATQKQIQTGRSQRLLRMAMLSANIFEGKLTKTKPPQTNTIDHRDNYFGTSIRDPYRWLESISSTDVKEWVKQQNLYSAQFLENIPGRTAMHRRMWELFVADPYVPLKIGKYYFFGHKPLQCRRSKLFRVAKLGCYPSVVLDGNALPENVQIITRWISSDGRYVAYTVSESGSEWVTLRIKNLETGRHCKEQLKGLSWVQLYWKDDSSGFYYSAILKSDKQAMQKVFFHKLNSGQIKDQIVYQGKDPDAVFSIETPFDGKYLLISSRRGGNLYSLKIKSLTKSNFSARTILNEQEHKFSFVGWHKNRLFFLTDMGAAKQKLVALTITDKSNHKQRFTEIIGEERDLLINAVLLTDVLVAFYWTERGYVLRCLNYLGVKLHETRLPKYTAMSFLTDPDQELFLKVQGYTFPVTIFHYTPKTNKLSLSDSAPVPFDTSRYMTELHYARSKDGTRIPVYLSYKKGLKRNGGNPVILTGYGGFDKFVQPTYSSNNIFWMDLGGIFAEAAVRGGKEFGSSWRRSGMRRQKQNTFDDFIAVAEYMIKERFTKPARLGLLGGSNGGLLVAAVLVQRPDLFGAAEINAGLLDMLRYHEFDFARHYKSEYGCATDEDDFRALYAYSPLHQVKRAKYPAVLILAGANDDRVSPAHSYKFTAALQNCQLGKAPIILKVEDNTGHGGHYNSYNALDTLCFLGYHLGVLPKRLLSRR